MKKVSLKVFFIGLFTVLLFFMLIGAGHSNQKDDEYVSLECDAVDKACIRILSDMIFELRIEVNQLRSDVDRLQKTMLELKYN
jgi:hypothetical protein